ncbi:hypothetical protein [Streptomyces niveus]|uniref:hypothetical protein n=1 Tax=Streptomyces niveus TaxID=193462 RepID=UPI0033F5FC2B
MVAVVDAKIFLLTDWQCFSMLDWAAGLEAHEVDPPLRANISALRDARIAARLKNGDQTPAHILAVAECAGMSAPYFAERFAQCLRKPTRDETPWDRLEAALALPDLPSAPAPIAVRLR